MEELGKINILSSYSTYTSVKLPKSLKKSDLQQVHEVFYAGTAEEFRKVELTSEATSKNCHVYFDYEDPYQRDRCC